MRSFAAPSLLCFLAVVSLFSGTTQAQPVNDRPNGAVEIVSSRGLFRYSGSLDGATSDFVGLTNFDNFSPDLVWTMTRSVWFKWTAPIGGTAAVAAAGRGSIPYPWVLTDRVSPHPLYSNVPDRFRYVTHDYTSINGYTEATFAAQAGVTYYIVLEGYFFDSNRTQYLFAHQFQQSALSDDFDTRTPIYGRNFQIVGNTASFSEETGEPKHGPISAVPAGKTAWMTWSSPTRATVTLTVESFAFDPLIGVYTGTEVDALSRVALSGLKTGITIAGQPRQQTLTFIADAGVPYHFVVDGAKNASGYFTMDLEASTARPGFLVRPTPVTVFNGDTATFSAVVQGTGEVSYRWQRYDTATKKWVDIEDDVIFTGATTATLSITPTTMELNNTRYRLMVSDDVGPNHSNAVVLTVTELPAINTEILGKVEANLSLGGFLPPPTNGGTYYAKGLPKGLTLDPVTGLITGTIRNAKPGTYRVVYGSTDGKVRNPQQFVLLIVVAPFSPPLTGTFEVLVDGLALLPAGKVTLRTTAAGSYTGTYFDLATGRSHSFRGLLDLDQNARIAGTAADTPAVISRGRGAEPLYLTFTLAEPDSESPSTAVVATAVVRDSFNFLVAQGFDGVKVNTFKAPDFAPWAGRYTVRLTDQQVIGPAMVGLPQGSGYSLADINALGALSLRGRLADNTAFTAKLSGSPGANYRVAQRVHGAGGSLAGRITLAEEPSLDLTSVRYQAGPDTDSRLFWRKPLRARDRIFPEGTGPAETGALGLDFRMQSWINAANSFVTVLGLSTTGEGAGEFKFNIDGGGVTNNALTTEINPYQLPITAFLNQRGVVTYPGGNPTAFKISFNAATGGFTGSFRVTEEPQPGVARTVKFSGVLSQYLTTFQGDVIGEGFFLLPPLAPSTSWTSGLIELRAGPPNWPFEITEPTP
jgi:hypothetical protein